MASVGMILEVEGKRPMQIVMFEKIESELRKLKSYGKSSFASLTRPDGSYIQVAGGIVTCILEWRDVQDRRHFRAYLKKPRRAGVGATSIQFGGGVINVEYDEIGFIDDAIDAFRSFFECKSFSDIFSWRDITETLQPD